jgi:hypothetical protein
VLHDRRGRRQEGRPSCCRLALETVEPLLASADRLTLTFDDPPGERYGPHVAGTGSHHNPSPGAARLPYIYGRLVAALVLLVTHAGWGVVALRLLARVCGGKKDLIGIRPKRQSKFHTEPALAVEVRRRAVTWLEALPSRAG